MTTIMSSTENVEKLQALVPDGPYDVDYCDDTAEGQNFLVAFLTGKNGATLLRDENPSGYSAPLLPILEYLVALDAAYRSGRLIPAPTKMSDELADSWAGSGAGGCDVQAGDEHDDPAPTDAETAPTGDNTLDTMSHVPSESSQQRDQSPEEQRRIYVNGPNTSHAQKTVGPTQPSLSYAVDQPIRASKPLPGVVAGATGRVTDIVATGYHVRWHGDAADRQAIYHADDFETIAEEVEPIMASTEACRFIGSTGYDAECRSCGAYTSDFETRPVVCPRGHKN